MTDNSNPQGTGTGASATPADDGFDNWLGALASDDEDTDAETGEEGPDDPELPDEGAEDDGDSVDEEATEEPRYKLPGSDEEVSLSELLSGYSRQADYTRKTQELAAERQKTQARMADLDEQSRKIEANFQSVNKTLETAESFIRARIGEPPSLELAVSNPQEYTLRLAYHQAQIAELNKVVEARQNASEEANARQRQIEERQAALEAEKIVSMFPEFFKKPNGHEVFADVLIKTASSHGFSRDEVMSINDSRLASVLIENAKLKAQLFGKTKPNTASKPNSIRPNAGAQPARNGTDGRSIVQAKAVQTFRKSTTSTSAKKALDSGAFDAFL